MSMLHSKGRFAATVVIAVALAACGPGQASIPPVSVAPATVAPAATASVSQPVTSPPSSTPGSSASAAPSPVAIAEWRSAARMSRPRTGFDAVVLGDGSVLAVGDDFGCTPGGAAPGSERAERYDPSTDAWASAASLNKPRKEPATVVQADGSALVIGGLNDVEQAFSSTKRFDAGTGKWTDGPLMKLGRETPLGVTLPDGKVFVVSETKGRFTSELLDPAAGSWRTTAPLPPKTRIDDMVTLAGGMVLAVGFDENGLEAVPAAYRYDPADDAWTGAQGLERFGYELVALPDGSALAIGGEDLGAGGVTGRVHRFDPGTGSWTEVASMSTPRSEPQVVVLDDGRVLVAGGSTGSDQALTSSELYDPAADRWTPGSDLLEPRYGGHALALPGGSVLILGGAKDFNTEGDTPWCPTPLVTTERLSVS